MPACARYEKLTAINTDARIVLGFAAPADAVAGLLPEGWEPDVATTGSAREVNLRVTFIETLATRNAAGEVLVPPRIVHLSVPARETASREAVTMLVVACSTGGNGGPYGNSVHASASIARRSESPLKSETVVDERWEFRTRKGHAVALHIEYTTGTPTVVRTEDCVRSATRPDVCRIYRTEQAKVVLRDAATDRIQRLAFNASGPLFSRVFDGSGRLISVDAVPWYTRQVFLPDSRMRPSGNAANQMKLQRSHP